MYSDFPFHLAIHHLKRGVGSHRHDFVKMSLVIGEGIERINRSHTASTGRLPLCFRIKFMKSTDEGKNCGCITACLG